METIAMMNPFVVGRYVSDVYKRQGMYQTNIFVTVRERQAS